ncbi:uncharacterized protein LOC110720620 [Chenopodium quinoa]|uniref:uncharacterized protein LOC110720620 n=1 Tax=Chenopodium quinoa TaxID=63459 RepID=UPI000B775208|nr:uncharacterized protein LOC110720620 [Chenopodium quinoa]
MKQNDDRKRRDEQFEIGETVYLKLQPYRQRSLAKRPFEKLAARYYGPFKVVERIGKVAYKLELPPSSRIHPVFHISQLKRAVGDVWVNPSIPEQISPEMELAAEPEELLEVRHKASGGKSRVEVLIKWKGLPQFEATWEDGDAIAKRFPTFHLEDKVNLEPAGNVIEPPIKVYARRRKVNRGQEGANLNYHP